MTRLIFVVLLVSLTTGVRAHNPAASAESFAVSWPTRGKVEIRWRMDSPLFRNARSASLTIRDGSGRHVEYFDAARLSTGRIRYTPSTAGLTLEFRVARARGPAALEQVLVVDGWRR